MIKKIIVVALIIGIVGYLIFTQSQSANTFSFDSSKPTDITLFWGQGCSHCEKVKQYISDNNIGRVINIDSKEIYYNQTNQALYLESIKKCPQFAANPDSVGVPFAVTKDNLCLSGDQPIINQLQSLINLNSGP